MKLSVIIPIYNNSQFFDRFLDCIIAQQVEDCEFIVVDDGSKEDIYSELKKKIEKADDKRVRLIRLNKNLGYGAAVNYGIDNSYGEYIGLYEPDDIIQKDFFSVLLEYANCNSIDIIKYNGLIKRKGNKDYKIFSYNKNYTNKIFNMHTYKRLGYSHPSITNGIYRKEFLRKNWIKFCHGKGASYQDQQFRISIWYANPRILIIDDCKYIYCFHDNQSVSNHNDKIDNIILNWKEEYSYLKLHYSGQLVFFIYSFYREIKGIKNKVSYENYIKLKSLYFELYRSCRVDFIKAFSLRKNIIEFINFYLFTLRLM